MLLKTSLIFGEFKASINTRCSENSSHLHHADTVQNVSHKSRANEHAPDDLLSWHKHGQNALNRLDVSLRETWKKSLSSWTHQQSARRGQAESFSHPLQEDSGLFVTAAVAPCWQIRAASTSFDFQAFNSKKTPSKEAGCTSGRLLVWSVDSRRTRVTLRGWNLPCGPNEQQTLCCWKSWKTCFPVDVMLLEDNDPNKNNYETVIRSFLMKPERALSGHQVQIFELWD